MEKNYVNGSDLLLMVGDKCIGHCTSHTLTYNTETKERAVKPVQTASKSSGLWKGKGVTSVSIEVKAEGLVYTGETENGFEALSALWGTGASVTIKAFERGEDTAPYLSGSFVISSLEEQAPAQDDVTYSISLENDGEPDIYPGKVTTN